jgi:hypothetical protein
MADTYGSLLLMVAQPGAAEAIVQDSKLKYGP